MERCLSSLFAHWFHSLPLDGTECLTRYRCLSTRKRKLVDRGGHFQCLATSISREGKGRGNEKKGIELDIESEKETGGKRRLSSLPLNHRNHRVHTQSTFQPKWWWWWWSMMILSISPMIVRNWRNLSAWLIGAFTTAATAIQSHRPIQTWVKRWKWIFESCVRFPISWNLALFPLYPIVR